jgi:hypothetical protein
MLLKKLGGMFRLLQRHQQANNKLQLLKVFLQSQIARQRLFL